MKVTLISFGYKDEAHRPRADAVIDCRVLANPHRVPQLRNLTGQHMRVIEFVQRDPSYSVLLDRSLEEVRNGSNTVAFGCYGGRHRSVAMAEIVAAQIKKIQPTAEVELKHLGL